MELLPAFVGTPEENRVYHCEALTLVNALAPQSVDMILADLPYGTTACAWDEIIPLAPMWAAFKRVIKPHGAIVLTATEPFASMLRMSWLKGYKYDMVWIKSRYTDYMRAKLKPMNAHEMILVFSLGTVANGSSKTMAYYPQMREGDPYKKIARSVNTGNTVGYRPSHVPFVGNVWDNQGERYPISAICFESGNHASLHPTQKPVALFDYLIRTYTQEGDLVLDPTCGSGTTAIAARNTGRRFICGDLDAGYVEIARARLAQPYTPDMFLQASGE